MLDASFVPQSLCFIKFVEHSFDWFNKLIFFWIILYPVPNSHKLHLTNLSPNCQIQFTTSNLHFPVKSWFISHDWLISALVEKAVGRPASLALFHWTWPQTPEVIWTNRTNLIVNAKLVTSNKYRLTKYLSF